VKYVGYGIDRIMTADAVADAVIAYAAMLAGNGMTEAVAIPAIDLDGTQTVATLLLGPGIPLAVLVAPDDELEPDAEDFLRDVAIRTANVQRLG
jgi:hypothetical protein